MRRYLFLFSFSVLAIIVLFTAATVYIHHQAIMRHETAFQEQQSLQVYLAKQAFADRIDWHLGELEILRTHSLPEFVSGKRDTASMTDLFRNERAIHQEYLALLFVGEDRKPQLAVTEKTQSGRLAGRFCSEWVAAYWEKLSATGQKPIFPDFKIDREHQVMGILLPVRSGGRFRGVLAVAVDLHPIVERYIRPMRSGRYGAAYLLDERGTIVYDHETEIIGRNIFDGMHSAYPDLWRIDKRLLHDPSGTDEYNFTVKRGGQVSRKLIAWNTVTAGDRKLVICLSAPDVEISEALYSLRIQLILSSAFLTAALIVLSVIFFRARQHILERSNRLLLQRVRERTAELKESRELHTTLIATVPDIVVRTDLEGTVLFINDIALEISGYRREELVGRNLLAFIVPEDHERVATNTLLMFEGPLGPREYHMVMKDGRKVLFEVNGDLLRDENGDACGMVHVCRDISDRRRMEKESRQLAERLHRAEKMEALGTLAGGVAHDLNNILSGLVSYPDLLLLDLPRDNPMHKNVMRIKESGQKAAAIVQDMLTLARRGVAVDEVVDINDIVRDILQSPELMEIRSLHPGVTFETDMAPDLLNISGSPVHLQKTVLNLVSNATEAIEAAGSVCLSTANRYIDRPVHGYEEVREGDYVRLRIVDSGTGISPEDLERIFEPFYTKKIMGRSGTGLGMALVWGAVKDHNGYIDIHSSPGAGTRCDLYFPVTRREPLPPEVAASLGELGGNEKILVVDDIEVQRELACELLRRLGYDVEAAMSGEEAVALLERNPVDLVLLDMIMEPGIDGLETYRRIIERHPHQKALIVSGFSETERVKEAQRLGAGAYLKKPYILEQLGKAVRSELDKDGPVSRPSCGAIRIE